MIKRSISKPLGRRGPGRSMAAVSPDGAPLPADRDAELLVDGDAVWRGPGWAAGCQRERDVYPVDQWQFSPQTAT